MDHIDDESPVKAGENQNPPPIKRNPSSLPIKEIEDPTLLVRFEERPGTLPGDVRVRMVRPSRNAFRRTDAGILEATTATDAPRNARERVTQSIKRLVIGAPLSNIQAEHERLTKFKALAVLSSDAISSVAYATEAILLTLLMAHANLAATLPICIAIVALLAIVATSYLQTIPAYPGGGGSYIVAKDNLGTLPGLIAAASLLIDYILTVSVSISAGVQNLVSLFSNLSPYVVLIDVALVAFITIVNLRGVRESGTIFAIPTYVFIVSALFMIAVGVVRSFLIAGHPLFSPYHGIVQNQPLALFLILKAFAAGCSAMTGVEAISNGVPAFKKPEPRNASITLASMALILGVLFIGITVLGLSYGIVPNEAGNPTVISQIAANIFNNSPLAFMYPVFTIATLFILTLAANTSYSDFPRLASLLARDDFLPHQFAFRGDRLAFSTGIVFLAVLAGGLLVIFEGDTTRLINLYAVGVFLSFTLSQGGMVLHWWRLRGRQRGWQRSIIINGVGAVTTLLVAAVISSTKFFEGAWIVVILIPILVLAFMGIHKHYHTVEEERTTGTPVRVGDIRHRLIIPIAGLDRVSRQTIAYGRSISSHLTAVHVAIDSADAEKVREQWREWQDTLPENEKTQLVVIDSPYRSLARPLLAYIDSVHEIYSDDTLTVILPEFVASHWWENILHNQTALQLKAALLFRPGIIVTSVPQHLPGRTKVKHT